MLRERASSAMRAFSISGQKCLSRVFVIFISENLSTNLCQHLRRLNVSYNGEISLHFDLPSLYSSCTQSPLLWALIRILYLDTARFIKLLYVRSPFKLLGHLRTIGCRYQQNSTLARSLCSFRTAPPRSI